MDLARSNPNPKTQLLCLKTCRPETYDNKQGKPDPWRSGGVAIVGDCTKRDDRFAVSIEARKWKALTRKIHKMK